MRRLFRWRTPCPVPSVTIFAFFCVMLMVPLESVHGQGGVGDPGWYAGLRSDFAVPRARQFNDWDWGVEVVGIAGRRISNHFDAALGLAYGRHGDRSRFAPGSSGSSTSAGGGSAGNRITRMFLEARYSKLSSSLVEPFLLARIGWVGKTEDLGRHRLTSSGVELGFGLGVSLWTSRNVAFEFAASEARVYLGDERLSSTYWYPRAAWHNIIDVWLGVRITM